MKGNEGRSLEEAQALIRAEIAELLNSAEREGVLDAGHHASQLHARYPQAGYSHRYLLDEIVRQASSLGLSVLIDHPREAPEAGS